MADVNIHVDIDPAKLAELREVLNPAQVDRAIISSKNWVADRLATIETRAVGKNLNLKYGAIRARVKVQKSNSVAVAAKVVTDRKGIPLTEYGAREIGAKQTGFKKIGKGVRVTIDRSKGVESHPHYFIARTHKGFRSVFDRVKTGAARVKRGPTEYKTGPTVVGHVANHPGLLSGLEATGNEMMNTRLTSQIDRFLNRQKPAND